MEQLQAITASGLDNVVTRAGHWRGLELSSQQQSSPQSRWKVCSGPQVRPPEHQLHTKIFLSYRDSQHLGKRGDNDIY